ncbi:MAG: hypothetical protein EOO52_11495 [Gammaproteobacteria bacterium]|nr:MAG: hypothetical protein EOO52_11495 [Gammaproteobacteria bacterium]
MKLQHSLAIILFLSAGAYAQNDKSCEAAVDAAASMNMNQPDCDYTDKGLNGFLHKAFKKDEEGAVLETSKEGGSKEKSPASEKNAEQNKSEKVVTKSFLLSIKATQWSELTSARTQLLSKAMEKCETGFSVSGENYHVAEKGKLELSMRFECMNK